MRFPKKSISIGSTLGAILILAAALLSNAQLPKLSDISSAIKNASLPITRVPGKIIKPFIKNDEQCYDDLGCFKRFPMGDYLLGLADAVSGGQYPESPEIIDVQFLIYTCTDRYRPHVMAWNATDDEILAVPLDPRRLTVFIVHGYLDNYDEMNWMGDMKDFIMNVQTLIDLREGACEHNVIGVDWSGGSKKLRYSQATSNTQMVGAVIARFIRQLIRLHQELTPNDFSIAGHSLGSHIAGFAGSHFPAGSTSKKLNNNNNNNNSNNNNNNKNNNNNNNDNNSNRREKRAVGTEQLRSIIGLDPAGPGFSDINNTYRLDPSDARLVLSIHTNGGPVVTDFLGIVEPLGHYAFYPNGGSEQPGCTRTAAVSNHLVNGFRDGVKETLACDHLRAYLLVQVNETQLTTAHSMGYRCESYKAFEDGKCAKCETDSSDDCKPFGNWFTWWQRQTPPAGWRKPISYFLDTTHKSPYTLYHYRVTVRTKQSAESFKGYIKLTMIGDLRDADQIKIDPGTIKSNQTYTYLVKVPKDLGAIKRAIGRVMRSKATRAVTGALGKVGLPVDDDSVDPTKVIDYVDIKFMSHEKARFRKSRSTRLRPTTDTLLYRIRKIGNVFVPI